MAMQANYTKAARSPENHAQSRVLPYVLALLVMGGTGGAQAADGTQPLKKPMTISEAAAAKQAEEVQAEEVKPGLAGRFLASRFARRNQDLNESAKYLSDTLALDPNNEALQHEVLRSQFAAGNLTEATAIAIQLDPSRDPVVATVLLLNKVSTGDYAGAKALVDKAPGAGLFGLTKPLMGQWLSIASGATKGQVNLQAMLDKAGFFTPFIRYQEALMQDVLGNTSAARLAYVKAISDSGTTPYRVVEAAANFYERQNEWDKAQAVFDAYAKANPDSSLLPDPITPADASKVTPLVADARQGLAELYFTTASIVFGEHASQDTFVYLRAALALRPDFPPAQLMLANLFEQTGDYNAAIATYDAIDPSTVFYRRGQVRKALNLEAQGKKDQALELLEAVSKANPNDVTSLITRADMLRDAERYGEAAEVYSSAIKRSEPLKESSWPLLYARGISYERAGQWDAAEADFTRALQLSPNQPDVLNYLGYSWLTMGKNLDRARQYLELAQAQKPDEPHIADSVGWARYLTGDYKGAAEKLEEAVERMPDDATVNDHLGDAYWRMGRTNEAKFQWQRALGFKPEAKAAEALRNKLENGLPADAPLAAEGKSANGTDVSAVPGTTATP